MWKTSSINLGNYWTYDSESWHPEEVRNPKKIKRTLSAKMFVTNSKFCLIFVLDKTFVGKKFMSDKVYVTKSKFRHFARLFFVRFGNSSSLLTVSGIPSGHTTSPRRLYNVVDSSFVVDQCRRICDVATTWRINYDESAKSIRRRRLTESDE